MAVRSRQVRRFQTSASVVIRGPFGSRPGAAAISPIALEAVKRIDAQYFPSPYSTVPRSAVSIANTLRMSD
jgi:hypothetical protein